MAKVKAWLTPDSLEREYIRFFMQFVKRMNADALKLLTEGRLLNLRLEEPEKFNEELLLLLLILKRTSRRWIELNSNKINDFAKRFSKFNDKQFIRVVQSGAGIILKPSQVLEATTLTGLYSTPQQVEAFFGQGVDAERQETYLPELISIWVATQLSYLNQVVENYTNDLEASLRDSLTTNKTQKEILADVSNFYATIQRRARLQAMRQSVKIDSLLTEARQRSMGRKDYIWRTKRDERVRRSHRALEGKRRSWNKGIKPGEEWGCRCIAQMTFD